MLKKLGVTMQEKDNKRFEDNKQYMSVQNSLKNKIKLFHDDLPDDIKIKGSVAVDTETMGLIFQRDRLCLIQMADSDGNCYLVKISKPYKDCPNIKKLMEDKKVLKLFHFARFDIAVLKYALGIEVQNFFCTKIASKLVRTYTDRHGLKELCRELAGIHMNKMEQSSDWGNDALTDSQKVYAASDVVYLHKLYKKLSMMLDREGRRELFDAAIKFLPHRIQLDIFGMFEKDIFGL